MVKAIIRTGKIEITNDKYYLCYQLEDKELMIDYKIEELFRKNHSIPLHTMKKTISALQTWQEANCKMSMETFLLK